MVKKLLLVFFVFGTFMMKAQNLYVDSNAASPINESNTTTGWTGQISLISDNTDAQSGLFSLRSESPGDGSTWVEYSFNAVNGQDYTISIWAREGNQSNEPAFANWQGLNGFNTTLISGNGWTEYVFNVTATSNNPAIRVYVSPYRSRFEVGNSVLLDNISIILAGGDTEAPNAVSDLSSSNTSTTSTDLSWSNPGDNVGVTDYEVFQDGGSLGLTGGATTFNVTGLTASTGYAFTVFARDAAGNVSMVSNTENVNTQAGGTRKLPMRYPIFRAAIRALRALI
ncbi:fibronectin type III domain-containing protein [Flagellimonas sp. CMM7]|uniref:fibronectin type III domain-containing protein n=1 Tax=Flagellimonas sp. CMM7 TaxID=2654676 RepID=UPI001F26F9D5|nr:fibronectin type III domain-containing protein [Flagellimonas sp. CMM7]UII79927.1 fibronectin type III domain-containing protein [Flagellimonas sp. CMM7]